MASFFGRDELIAILPVLGINFLLRALGMTHYALAQKRLQFRTRTGAELADVVVRGSAGIGLAIAGFGAWSLVIGYVVGSLTMTVVLWMLIPWRPSRHSDREGLGGMLRFGGTLTVVNILSAMIAKADSLFVGRILGANALGLYALGFRLPELIVFNLSVVASQVLFPAFAAVGREGLGEAYTTSLRYMLMIGLPSAAVLAILAEPVILVAFGDQWRGSIEPMQILTLFALLVAVSVPAGTAYKAMGRVDVILKLALPRAAAVITLLWLFTDEGLAAAAACQAAVAAVWAVIDFGIASRMLAVPVRRIAAAAWPPLVATLPLAGVLLAAGAVLDGPLVTLLVGTVVGAVVYLATLWFVARDSVAYLLDTALPGRRAKAAAARS
jgi:O-antigen/teichoic acid export membrane protein